LRNFGAASLTDYQSPRARKSYPPLLPCQFTVVSLSP
jgi:hypothetical protein